MSVDANVYRKDWEKIKIFNISNGVNFKQIKGFLNPFMASLFKPKFESHKKLSRKTHTLQRL